MRSVGERRQHGQADRAAHLHAGVDQARGEPGVLRRRARHRQGHDRREGGAHADADQQERRQQVGQVVAVDRGAGEEQQRDDGQADAGDQRRRGPKRMISFSEKPSESVPITIVVGRKARPTSRAL